MSDIKRLVSAATAQWLPVALGALAVPSGARHQWKSPQSQGPSVSVCVCVCLCETWWNVITGPVLWEPPWKGPHSEATKAPFCFFSSAFSLFIYLCVGEPDEEGGLSLSRSVFSVYVSRGLTGNVTCHCSPTVVLTPHITAATISNIYTGCV